ncbi:hypothetical protein [Sediminicurvatus halobius]|nr:hypothetical protein [Spiribacter halobius]UEX76849.1 hypothetical protein LMH63_12875 [Spiribacter halobius]
MSEAHRKLIELIARQAVREHLTRETAQRRDRESGQQNRACTKRAANG